MDIAGLTDVPLQAWRVYCATYTGRLEVVWLQELGGA